MKDDNNIADDSYRTYRLLYLGAAAVLALFLVLAGVILLASGDDKPPLRSNISPPTATPIPTGTPFPTATFVRVASEPTPTETSQPTMASTSTASAPAATPTRIPITPEEDWSSERNCVAGDEVLLEAEGGVRSWVRNTHGQYAVYNISMLTDEIIEAGIIENVDYERNDWGESYSLYDEGSFEAYFEIIHLDSTTITISTYADVITGKAFFLPDVLPGATLRVTFARDSDPASLRLRIDDDGDGEIDRELEPDGAVTGRAACETVEPVFRAETAQVEPGVAEVTLIGEDNEGGSGIGGIFYHVFDDLSDTQQASETVRWPSRYVGPIRIDKGSIVLFLGWDNAGNTTIWQDVVVLGGFGPDVAGSIEVDGPAVQIETPLPGQNALLQFEGQAGQRVAAVLSDNTYGQSPSQIAVHMRILSPDGELLGRSPHTGSLDEILEVTLEVDGTHTLVVDPFSVATGEATVALYGPVDSQGTISFGGSPATVMFDTPGQRATLTFEATAGQRLAVDAIALVRESGGCLPGSESFFDLYVCNFKLELLGPDGEVIDELPFVDERGDQTDILTLPTTGTYRIEIDPGGLVTGVVDIRLLTFDPGDVLIPDGSPVTVTLERPGEVASIGFTGEARQTYLVTISDVKIGTSRCCTVHYHVLTPDGERAKYGYPSPYETGPDGPQTVPSQGAYASEWNKGLPHSGFVGTDGEQFLMSTPEDGQYTLILDPDEGGIGSLAVSMEKLGPVWVDAVIDGPAIDLEIRYSEQPGIVQFTGDAGDPVVVDLAVDPESAYKMYSTDLTIFGPDGRVLYADGGVHRGIVMFTPSETGIHWLELVNRAGNVDTVTVQLSSR